MNNLKGTISYMVGAIQEQPDDIVGLPTWRKDLISKTKDLGVNWIDPTHKPGNILKEIEGAKAEVLQMRANGEFEALIDRMCQIRLADLHFVTLSDFIVFNLDPAIPTFGSWEEIFLAFNLHKPVLIICKNGITNLPFWLFALVRENEVFASVNELATYLHHINDADLSDDRRWLLFRKELTM